MKNTFTNASRKILSLIVVMAIVLSGVPVLAAAEDTLPQDNTTATSGVTVSETQEQEAAPIAAPPIGFAPAAGNTDLSAGNVVINTNGTYTITGTTTTNTITVNSGVTANITLNGVNIDVNTIDNACAFDMTGAIVNLTLSGTNTLKSGTTKAGLQAPEGATLTIVGASAADKLTVTGGTNSAGIGGNGGGSSVNANGGTVTINGGTVIAKGGNNYGAGIGGGAYGNGGVVTINGGEVIATGGDSSGAGIGGGDGGGTTTSGTVTINGGTVTAINANKAAIGGSSSAGTVTVNGTYDWWHHNTANPATATQGSGAFVNSPTYKYVKVEVSTLASVIALRAAAKTDVTYSLSEDITITNNTENDGDGYATGLYVSGDFTLDLNGKELNINLDTISNGIKIAAGKTLTIKDSSAAKTGKLTINNNKTGGGGGGLGAGINTTDGHLIINSGKVTAKGGDSGAGIGGGQNGGGGTVTINGGTVEAVGGSGYSYSSAGIGGGEYSSDQGTVTVNGTYEWWHNNTNSADGATKGTDNAFVNNSAYRYVKIDVTTLDSVIALRLAAKTDVTYSLSEDIAITNDTEDYYNGTLSTPLKAGLYVTGDFTLDLNGKELNINLNTVSNGIKIAAGKTLTIKDSSAAKTGKLTINITTSGGGVDRGAGINTTNGELVIESGTVVAQGSGGGAGIGGGVYSSSFGAEMGAGGKVTITGGKVTAIGSLGISDGGAGIGGGSGGTVTISGGTVTANGDDDGAGIGGGGNGGTLKITGGSVKITKGTSAPSNVIPQATNGSANVYLSTLTLEGVSAVTEVTALTAPSGYGITDVYTNASGELYFYLPVATDTAVSLTASSKTYSGKVSPTSDNEATATLTEAAGKTDAEKVAEDKAELTFDSIKDGNTAADNITDNLAQPLPSSGTNGSTVTWSSDNTAVIANDGTVTRPDYGAGDAIVTLTATITIGTESDTKTFTLTVKQKMQKQTTVEVKTNTPQANATGLDALFTAADDTFLQANAGASIEYKLVIEQKAAPANDVTLVNDILTANTQVLYLDVSLWKEIAGAGTSDGSTKLDNAVSPITITIDLPQSLRNKAPYTIIRVHGSDVTTITPVYDSTLHTLTFTTDKFSTYAIAYTLSPLNPPVPPTSPSYNGGSSSGGNNNAATASTAPTQWVDESDAKALVKSATGQGANSVRTSSSREAGIRKKALQTLGKSGLTYRHDTVANGAVQVRVYVDDPSAATKDILVSGYTSGANADKTTAIINKWFSNNAAVIALDQQGNFGMKVQIAAKVDLSGMDTSKLYFYSYDKATNKYRLIVTEYRIDSKGYVHFSTVLAGSIIITDAPLSGSAEPQNPGTGGDSAAWDINDLQNPNTGGDGMITPPTQVYPQASVTANTLPEAATVDSGVLKSENRTVPAAINNTGGEIGGTLVFDLDTHAESAENKKSDLWRLGGIGAIILLIAVTVSWALIPRKNDPLVSVEEYRKKQ